MKTFEKFTREIYESDIILSEARSVLVEKDSDAVKQYKKGEKSFKKGFGKSIKPTVVQPALDLYKAGGPYVPDKTTFKDTGKKVPKMEPKPQFGTPKTPTKSGAPDRTLVKKAIKDVKDSEKRLFQKGLGKGTAGVKGVKGKPGISLPRQRKYTKDIIKDLSAKTTQSDARMRGSSTEGTAGAGGSSKTTKPKLTPTKGVKQSEVSKKAQEFTKKTNQARVEKISKPKTTNLFNKVKPKGDGKVKNSKGIGNKYRGNSPEAKALKQQAIDARSGKPQLSSSSSNIVKKNLVTSSDRPNKGFKNSVKSSPKVTTNRTYGPRNQFKSEKQKLNLKPVKGKTAATSDVFNLTKNPLPQGKPVINRGEPKLPQFSKAESPSFKLSPKGQKFASKIPKALRGKTAAKIGKAALKSPTLAAVAGVGLAAAAGYGAYKAFKNFNKKKDLTYKDFRSLSTPSDPNKGKIIHTRDIPKKNIKKGDVARFSSSSKIPKSSSAEFKSNYAYK